MTHPNKTIITKFIKKSVDSFMEEAVALPKGRATVHLRFPEDGPSLNGRLTVEVFWDNDIVR